MSRTTSEGLREVAGSQIVKSMNINPDHLIPYPEKLAQRVAGLLGSGSAAALALKEMKARRKDGEAVFLWRYKTYVLVGPVPRQGEKS